MILSILFTRQVTVLTFDYFSFKSSTKINLLPFNVYDDHGNIDNNPSLTLITKSTQFMREIINLSKINEGDIIMPTNESNKTIDFDNYDNDTFNDDDDIDTTHIPDKCDDEFRE